MKQLRPLDESENESESREKRKFEVLEVEYRKQPARHLERLIVAANEKVLQNYVKLL